MLQTMGSSLFKYQHALLRSRRANLVLGLGVGLSFRTDINENIDWNYCDSAFCNLPEYEWVFTPGVQAIIPVVGNLSFTAGLEYNGTFEEAMATFPYQSGLLYLVGLELN